MPDPTRPTIFVELTQAEAQAVMNLIEAHDQSRPKKPPLMSVESKLHEAQTDDDIRSILLEDAIIDHDYNPEEGDR